MDGHWAVCIVKTAERESEGEKEGERKAELKVEEERELDRWRLAKWVNERAFESFRLQTQAGQ